MCCLRVTISGCIWSTSRWDSVPGLVTLTHRNLDGVCVLDGERIDECVHGELNGVFWGRGWRYSNSPEYCAGPISLRNNRRLCANNVCDTAPSW